MYKGLKAADTQITREPKRRGKQGRSGGISSHFAPTHPLSTLHSLSTTTYNPSPEARAFLGEMLLFAVGEEGCPELMRLKAGGLEAVGEAGVGLDEEVEEEVGDAGELPLLRPLFGTARPFFFEGLPSSSSASANAVIGSKKSTE